MSSGEHHFENGGVIIIAIEFFMPMEKVPTTTHQEKACHVVNGKPVFYEPADVKDVRMKLTSYLGQHIPEHPFYGAVRLTVKWCFPRGRHKNGSYKTTKPDTDNLNKMLKDVMTNLKYWKDDAQVASEITEKFWTDLPGIYIRIEELV